MMMQVITIPPVLPWVLTLNGTARVGKYLQVKDYDGKADPLASVICLILNL